MILHDYFDEFEKTNAKVLTDALEFTKIHQNDEFRMKIVDHVIKLKKINLELLRWRSLNPKQPLEKTNQLFADLDLAVQEYQILKNEIINQIHN